MNKPYNEGGFNLLELMITLAIIGILAAFAYPSYRQQMLRTHRTEGLTALQTAAARQERYYSNNSAYAPDMATLGVPALTEGGYYSLATGVGDCGAATRCYTLTATAQGGQTADTACTPLTLESNGEKGPAGCW